MLQPEALRTSRCNASWQCRGGGAAPRFLGAVCRSRRAHLPWQQKKASLGGRNSRAWLAQTMAACPRSHPPNGDSSCDGASMWQSFEASELRADPQIGQVWRAARAQVQSRKLWTTGLPSDDESLRWWPRRGQISSRPHMQQCSVCLSFA